MRVLVRADDVLLPLAVVVDLLFGEPPASIHPVVGMGRVVRALEAHASRASAAAELRSGLVIALAPPLAYAAVSGLIVRAWRRQPVVVLAAVPLLKGMFAIRALWLASVAVRQSLATDDLETARLGLRSLVSRESAVLDASQVAAAAIESLAENLNDSIVAPFFYYVLCGLPGAVAYRAVNTLDAMIGYRGAYEYFGKGAARLDDLLNLVPARLSAGLLLLAALLVGEDARAGWWVLRHDARLTASPNAGWPMAAMAGALGVELEKVGHYRLGVSGKRPDTTALRRAERLMLVAAVIAASGASFARWWRHG